jgi:hypothetical protein
MKRYKLFIEDEIEGGLADQYTCEQIANKHNVSLEDIMNQLYKGIEVEMEHTDDKELAKEIAKDHLTEYPYYYDELEKMEKKFENKRGIKMKRYKRKFEEASVKDALDKISKGVNDMTQFYLGPTCAEYISEGIFKGIDMNQKTNIWNKEKIVDSLIIFLKLLKFEDKQ